MCKVAVTISVIILLLAGCSVEQVKPLNQSAELRHLPRLDPNALEIRIAKSRNDFNELLIHSPHTEVSLSEPSRVSYKRFFFDFDGAKIIVAGKMPNGKNYDIWLDTGCAEPLVINTPILLENDLPVYPLFTDPCTGISSGLSYVSSLVIGDVAVRNIPCVYLQMHLRHRIIPLIQQKLMLVGVPVISKFDYVLFDNIKKQVEFSSSGPFKPLDASFWTSYPMSVKEGRLMVELPIQNQTLIFYFDTCARNAMWLQDKTWKKLAPHLGPATFKKGVLTSVYPRRVPCRKAGIKTLGVANVSIKDAEILILDGHNAVFPSDTIGMVFFKHTIVVLDFDRGLMWIKNNGSD